MKRIWLVVATLGAHVLMGGNQTPAAEVVAIDLTKWAPPDIGTVGDDAFGKLVKYGYALFTDTDERDRSGSVGRREAVCRQQSCLPKLPSAGRHAAVCYASDRRLGPIPAIPRAGGRG